MGLKLFCFVVLLLICCASGTGDQLKFFSPVRGEIFIAVKKRIYKEFRRNDIFNFVPIEKFGFINNSVFVCVLQKLF